MKKKKKTKINKELNNFIFTESEVSDFTSYGCLSDEIVSRDVTKDIVTSEEHRDIVVSDHDMDSWTEDELKAYEVYVESLLEKSE